jgi:BMFP domain-containing protein YqiC
MLRIAAAAVLLLGIGASAGIYLTSNPASPMVQTQQAQLPLEFVEVESYFQQQYREKLNQLASYQLEPGFQQDQQQFEQVMTELKQELAKAPEESRERIIASMIQNYHTKLDILQRLFEQLQSGNLNIENSEQNENLSL